MKTIFLLTVLIIIKSQSFAQTFENAPNWIVRGNDTILCKKAVSYQTFGFLTLKYITMDDEKVKLTGTKNCKIVSGYNSNYSFYDLIPLNPEKADKKSKYMQRVNDGAIRVNEYTKSGSSQSITGKSTDMNTNTTTTTYTTRNTTTTYGYIRMPDGKYYKANRSNLKNTIVPYLMKCEDVQKNFEDNKLLTYTYWNVKTMTIYYNLHCEDQ